LIKAVFHRPIEGKFKTVTLSKTPTDKYFASIFCEVEGDFSEPLGDKILGVDLGLKDFAVGICQPSRKPTV
jgi:putative transposase